MCFSGVVGGGGSLVQFGLVQLLVVGSSVTTVELDSELWAVVSSNKVMPL